MCSKKRSNSFCMRVHSPRIAVVPTDSQQNLQPARYSCTVSRALRRGLEEPRMSHSAPCPSSCYPLPVRRFTVHVHVYQWGVVGGTSPAQPRRQPLCSSTRHCSSMFSSAAKLCVPGAPAAAAVTWIHRRRVRARHASRRTTASSAAGSAAHARSASASSPSGTGPKWCCASSLLRDRPPKRGHPALAQARAPSG